VWVMVPAGAVDATIDRVAPLLAPGDTIVDGGNSRYHDDIRRARALQDRKLHYVDVGVSGGVWGLERGYCQMIGGDDEAVARLDPVFRSLAPTVDSAPPTPGRQAAQSGSGRQSTAEHGYLHCGPAGAGHFVKMVHNGIEYGVMAAYAEGFNLMRHAGIGLDHGAGSGAADAEITPLANPEHFQYDLNLADIAEVWRRGSVITSWLLDLTAAALAKSPDLGEFTGRVSDSGEGRWTVQAAIEAGVPAHVLTASLFERFESRGEAEFANRVLSAMRYAFGGHLEK